MYFKVYFMPILLPLEDDNNMSVLWGVVAIWVTHPLCPLRVPRRVICSPMMARFCGQIQTDSNLTSVLLPQNQKRKIQEGCGSKTARTFYTRLPANNPSQPFCLRKFRRNCKKGEKNSFYTSILRNNGAKRMFWGPIGMF